MSDTADNLYMSGIQHPDEFIAAAKALKAAVELAHGAFVAINEGVFDNSFYEQDEMEKALKKAEEAGI